jgi:hypothetical protein
MSGVISSASRPFSFNLRRKASLGFFPMATPGRGSRCESHAIPILISEGFSRNHGGPRRSEARRKVESLLIEIGNEQMRTRKVNLRTEMWVPFAYAASITANIHDCLDGGRAHRPLVSDYRRGDAARYGRQPADYLNWPCRRRARRSPSGLPNSVAPNEEKWRN